jgi:8-amino-7-oxononanoate synthase
LLTGNSKYYPELESFLAETYKRESALVFNSGYHANIGILPALSTKNDLILADKLVHASIIDGLKLCDAKIIRFRHNDLQQVEEILIKSRHEYESVFIATESVYSMDGDFCDLLKLTELKSRFNIMLYVDEAHAVGVFGKTGCGLAEEMGVMSKIDFIIGTFGKALASQGAFIVCDRLIFDFLINKMRSLIFTTALAPINLLWTKYIFEKIICMSKERDDLMKTSNYFRQQLQNHGFSTCGNSHIIPVILGENAESVRVSDHLQKQGIFVLPVRPPTVPDGTARVRFSINAQITKNDIDQVITALLSARK